ncbi:CIC11C00000005383 [Sungouiella intermedia]|uniref:CIC11C00000005383 n=1 Tax=Sungouiella intermedia TaxID=45354 RepID=A0A1L0BNA2_9ASCO|nr:CIC11C00000005383 [[Candida] intermedia]
MGNLARKRNRLTLVCTFCKRRKIRCDKKQPCSSCVTHGNSDCSYQTPTIKDDKDIDTSDNYKRSLLRELSTVEGNGHHHLIPHEPPQLSPKDPSDPMEAELVALRSKVERLEKYLLEKESSKTNVPLWQYQLQDFSEKTWGVVPYDHDTDNISFLENFGLLDQIGTTSARYFGPLSWLAMLKSDPALAPVIQLKKDEVLTKHGDPTNRPAGTAFKTSSQDPIVNEDLEFKPFKQQSRDLRLQISQLDAFNKNARLLGFPVCPVDILLENDLTQKIRLLIPRRQAMWRYLEIYFNQVYPVFPFIDQDFFEDTVHRLIHHADDHSPAQLKITKQMDLIYLGQILIVLRLGYLNMFPCISRKHEYSLPEREYLLDNPMVIESLEVANLCLQLSNYFRTCNLAVLQLVLYIRVYFMFAPEYGESPEDPSNQSITAQLIRMALSLGVHREPHLESTIEEKKMNNLRRKLWYSLINLEFVGSTANGFPTSIQFNQYDVDMPHFVLGGENVKSFALEKSLRSNFLLMGQSYDTILPVLEHVTSIRSPVLLKDLCADIQNWENKYFKTLKLTIHEIDGPLSVETVFESTRFLNSAVSATGIIFQLYLYYEKQGNIDLSYFYYKKLMGAVARNVVIIAKRFIKYSSVWFAETSHLTFVPVLEAALHRCMILLLSALMRTRYSVLQCEKLSLHRYNLDNDVQYASRYSLMVDIYFKLTKFVGIIEECNRRLSKRYCYSWKCVFVQESLRALRNGEDFFLKYRRGKEVYLLLTLDMLADYDSFVSEILQEVEASIQSKWDPQANGEDLEQAASTPGSSLSSGIDGVLDFANVFWLLMHQMKGFPDDSIADPTVNGIFDVEWLDVL